MRATTPTGTQFRLERDGVRAQIAQVGASLRALSVDGIDLVPTFPDDIPAPGASGVVLVPWPNRIRDGRWTQRGTTHQLAISEPALRNASHGLLRFHPYTIDEDASGTDRLTLAADVYPQTGYPFHLRTTVTYALERMGISVAHAIRNISDVDAPVALGAHPYLCIGDVPDEDLSIEIGAATAVRVDERLLPVSEEPVRADDDLRRPRGLRGRELDTAFGDLERSEGRASGRLHAPDGRAVELWVDDAFSYLQVFTNRRFPGRDLAVAIEPMSAPADAFNSGRGLRWLAPGETWNARWGISLRHPGHLDG